MEVTDRGNLFPTVDFVERLHHETRVQRVEGRDRLVGEDEPWMLHRGAADRATLLLAAREGFNALERGLRDAKPVKEVKRFVTFGFGEKRERRAQDRLLVQPAKDNICESIEARDQVELLKCEPHDSIWDFSSFGAQARSVER